MKKNHNNIWKSIRSNKMKTVAGQFNSKENYPDNGKSSDMMVIATRNVHDVKGKRTTSGKTSIGKGIKKNKGQ